jgi:hypothetical protein
LIKLNDSIRVSNPIKNTERDQMKLRIIFLAFVIQIVGIEFPGFANASFVAISPYFAIVDNGNNGGGSGTNLIVGTNFELKPFCQTG